MSDAAETAPVGHAAPEPSRRKRPGWVLFVRDLVIIIVVALLVSFLLKTFLIRSFYIPSGSMEDTLQINDRILVNELVPKAIPIERGDVVVFTDPGGWLTPTPEPAETGLQAAFDWLGGFVGLTAPDSNDHLIKRVIGLPGDTVSCCSIDGKLEVNGVAIDEPYTKIPAGQTADAPSTFSVKVKDGTLWVMGDNRYDSRDSLAHIDDPAGGLLPEADVVGRAFVITWPTNHWSGLSNYPSTFGVVPAPK